MCSIFNGSRRFLRRTTIIVLSPPAFTKVPQVIVGSGGSSVKEGTPLYLHCQAKGTPIPTVRWFFNGLPVVEGYKVGRDSLKVNSC